MPQLWYSSRMRCASSSALDGEATKPVRFIDASRSGSASMRRKALASLPVMAGGVPRGASSANHARESKPLRPSSPRVATSGRSARRSDDVTASGRTLPACTADRCLQVLGGSGYLADYPLERIFRDARVARIYEGTSQIMQLIIAKDLLRRHESAAL